MSVQRFQFVSLLLLLCGCASAEKHRRSALTEFDNGRPRQAIVALQDALDSRTAERELLTVDFAIAAMMAGNFSEAENALKTARREIDHLRQKDIREQTLSVLTDDKAIAWSGREFEQRMIDNLLILSSLLGDRQDAFAFASQATEHVHDDRSGLTEDAASDPIMTAGHSQDLKRSAAPTRHQANAFSAYLQAAVTSESPMNTDTTTSAIRDIGYWQNTGNNIVQTGFGVDSKPGHGVVHIVTFVGRITDWDSEVVAPTSAALLLADQILSSQSDHTVPPTVAPVRIAKPSRGSSTSHTMTTATITDTGQTFTAASLIDLNKVAMASYEHDKDKQIARAVVRRIIKKGAVYATKDRLSVNTDSGADVLLTLGGIAWEAMEKPDKRHLQLLPERIEVLQIQLPEGQHTVTLGTQPNTSSSKPINQTVQVQNGRNTFILCFRPRTDIVQVVTQSQ